MNKNIFTNISKIIERDKKVTTYKFALLRGVIDIIQENSPYIKFSQDRVHIPTGLLIEKWLLYYYPILESLTKINQNHGQGNLAFEIQFKKIIDSYKDKNGLSGFYNDLMRKGIHQDLHSDFISLATKLNNTITRMPMRYIGNSVNNIDYSIFKFETNRNRVITKQIGIEFLLAKYGSFSIPREYYEAFLLLGSFIGGQDSILFKWAEFSVNASKNTLSFDKVINEVLKSPVTKRDAEESKKLYNVLLRSQGSVHCVWTGNLIQNFEVDHIIPFSVWKNNDLWNLLPSTPATNKKKLDRIPAVQLIDDRKNSILEYWTLLNKNNKYTDRFQREIKVALIGDNTDSNWDRISIDQLKKTCDYLITTRGYPEWKI